MEFRRRSANERPPSPPSRMEFRRRSSDKRPPYVLRPLNPSPDLCSPQQAALPGKRIVANERPPSVLLPLNPSPDLCFPQQAALPGKRIVADERPPSVLLPLNPSPDLCFPQQAALPAHLIESARLVERRGAPVSLMDPGRSFTEEALRAGFHRITGEAVGPTPAVPISLMDPLQRAVEKERIREQMLRGYMERRILEEEVRRELEEEALREMLRFQEGSIRVGTQLAPPASDLGLRDGRAPILRSAVFEDGTAAAKAIETGTNAVAASQDRTAEVETGTGTNALATSQDKVAQSKGIQTGTEKSTDVSFPVVEVHPSNNKISGNKRKAMSHAKASESKRKVWRCVLCQVRATSEFTLNEHLKGKKHQAREAEELANKKPRTCRKSENGSRPAVVASPNNDSLNKLLKTVKMEVDGQLHEILQDGEIYWCKHCNVRSNNTITIANHLRGRRHFLSI